MPASSRGFHHAAEENEVTAQIAAACFLGSLGLPTWGSRCWLWFGALKAEAAEAAAWVMADRLAAIFDLPAPLPRADWRRPIVPTEDADATAPVTAAGTAPAVLKSTAG